MKIRQGFISNSSSSSFMIAYRRASIKEIDDKHVHIKGGYGCEGEIYFRPSQQIIDYVKSESNYDQVDHKYDFVYEYFHVDEVNNMTKQELLKIIESIPNEEKIQFETFEIDHFQPNDVEEFKTYIEGEY